jgi:hypothetical protein
LALKLGLSIGSILPAATDRLPVDTHEKDHFPGDIWQTTASQNY